MEDLLQTLGADVIVDPLRSECCGSYHTVNAKELVAERTRMILNSVKSRGAEVIVLSCPLCEFNLDARQKDTVETFTDFTGIPVLYFTQLMALALGLGEEVCQFNIHYVNPYPLLIEKNIIEEGEIIHGKKA
jgi:heterodisulfide reductase subunit B